MKVKDMLKTIVTERPDPKDAAAVRNPIYAWNNVRYGEKPGFFTVLLKSEAGVVHGGLMAYVHTDSIFIDILWVDDASRGQGYGTRLLLEAEKECVRRGIPYSTVDTFDFQAQPFYVKNGYEEIGTIPKYVRGFDRIFLRKKVIEGAGPIEEYGNAENVLGKM